jgi:hypothetical protein
MLQLMRERASASISQRLSVERDGRPLTITPAAARLPSTEDNVVDNDVTRVIAQ